LNQHDLLNTMLALAEAMMLPNSGQTHTPVKMYWQRRRHADKTLRSVDLTRGQLLNCHFTYCYSSILDCLLQFSMMLHRAILKHKDGNRGVAHRSDQAIDQCTSATGFTVCWSVLCGGYSARALTLASTAPYSFGREGALAHVIGKECIYQTSFRDGDQLHLVIRLLYVIEEADKIVMIFQHHLGDTQEFDVPKFVKVPLEVSCSTRGADLNTFLKNGLVIESSLHQGT
jgi:hypothetical protein